MYQPNHDEDKEQSLAPDMDTLDRGPFADAFSSSLLLPAKLEPHLEEALRHVLSHPGTLVRPRIVFEMALGYGLEAAHAQDLAVALEYFHTASLIFDDLPCMDNALERRGAPCVHVAFGEATAMLAALALINRAYALTWRSVRGAPHERQSRVLSYIESRLGVEGLLNGQSLDLHYAALPHDRRTTQRVAHDKTVSLIRLPLLLPALLGGASASELQLLERLALSWGLSYQIVDDLKDVLQSPAETGKTVARDSSLDRPNLALAIGVPAAVERLTRLMHLGDKTLERLIAQRPAIAFLQQLRDDLKSESVRLSQSACATRGPA
jgi:geranylgeranyl diphosphate synthase type II